MELIEEHKQQITNLPFAHYGLTGYVILTAIRRLLEQDSIGKKLCQNPKIVFDIDALPCVLAVVEDLLKSTVIDINHELKDGQMADYKSELKSRSNVEKLLNDLIRSYQKDKSRGKVEDIGQRLGACNLTA